MTINDLINILIKIREDFNNGDNPIFMSKDSGCNGLYELETVVMEPGDIINNPQDPNVMVPVLYPNNKNIGVY